jgi:hypothetical protein
MGLKKIVRPQKSWGPEMLPMLHGLMAGPGVYIFRDKKFLQRELIIKDRVYDLLKYTY